MTEKMEFEREWTKEELAINKLNIQVESLSYRLNHLEKCYIQWLKLKKFYNIEERNEQSKDSNR